MLEGVLRGYIDGSEKDSRRTFDASKTGINV